MCCSETFSPGLPHWNSTRKRTMKEKTMSLGNLKAASSSTPLCGSFKKMGHDHDHDNSAFANLSLLADVAIFQCEFDKQIEFPMKFETLGYDLHVVSLPEKIEKPVPPRQPRIKIIPPKKPMLSSVPIPNNRSGIDNLFLLAHAALIYEFDAEKERSMTMTMRNPHLKIIPPKKPQCSCSALIPTSENNILVPPKTKTTQEDEGKSQEPKAKRQRINPSVIRQVGPDPPPDLPTQFRDKINELQGSDLKLVIQKKLSETDMKSHFARLSLPNGQLRADFLSQEHQTILQQRQAKGNGRYRGLEVPLIEPQLVESTITVKKWKLGSSTSYTLGSQWQQVANDNGLHVGNIIQIWSFKVDQSPHLALVKL
uniref:TF-B3 domain-containing protein n=1 Tax=Fagus sylvatica TaxID=28930 RepID=A0A2N9HFK4_FAGSY